MLFLDKYKFYAMKQVKQKYININKKYSFPDRLSKVEYKDKILVISVNTACWLVLNNKSQLHFFDLLCNYSIKEAMNKFEGEHSDAVYVITQVEAKHFEDQSVMRASHDLLHLYLTNQCNMHCPHCYMFAGNKLKNELTTEEVKKLLQNYVMKGGKALTISGGEATMRSDLTDVIAFAHRMGLKIKLLTNGYLLSDELINNLSQFIQQVQISIDGFSEAENSKVRVKGSFDKVLHTIDRFVRNKVPTEIAVTPYLDSDLKMKVYQYADFGRKLVEKYKDFDVKVKYSTSLIDGRETNLDDEKRDYYSKTMNKITNIYFGKDVSDDTFIASSRQKRIYDNCSYGNLTVAANGDVYACSRIIGIKPYANIRTHSFDFIWMTSQKAKTLSDIKNLKPCNQCDLMYICGGNCRIKFFSFFKDCESFDDTEMDITRECNQSIKNSFYELMIRTDKQIYQ